MRTPGSKLAVIVAGGTGGHLYPGIATARALLQKGGGEWRVQFMVRRGDLGKTLLDREGFDVLEVSAQGLPRRPSMKMVTFPIKLAQGFQESWSALRRWRPAAIMGMGGYLSFPVLTAAHLLGIPTLIHEQNVLPGLANKILAHWVRSIAVSFSESKSAFPSSKVWLSGLPVRPEFGTVDYAEARARWGFAAEKLVVLVFGGSQGARRINDAVLDAWRELGDIRNRLHILHITGPQDFERIERAYAAYTQKAIAVPYTHDMPAALAASDLVISRAGASTVAELMIARKPAVLIPFPFASENHQFYNAEALAKAGAADLLPESNLSGLTLSQRLVLYVKDRAKLSEMRSRLDSLQGGGHAGAAERLADFLIGWVP